MNIKQKIPSEIALFIIFGIIQFGLDAALMLAYTQIGLPISISNLFSRACAGSVGYLLNGKFNFRKNDKQITAKSAVRFWVLWCALTLISTVLMARFGASIDGNPVLLIGLKFFVEGVLFMIGFTLNRNWVYRL